MKKSILLSLLFGIMMSCLFLLSSCSDDDDSTSAGGTTGSDQVFTVGGVNFTMKSVQGGTFWMGSQSTNSTGKNYDTESQGNESPVHQVTIGYNYWLGETEVTQALWEAVMTGNTDGISATPSGFTDATRPVERISWNEIQLFIKRLNTMTGKTFRLPSEAEWEFAARGGVNSNGCKYSGSDTIGNVAWYKENSAISGSRQTHPVASKLPNELDIYDMSGNVWEWCQDWYHNDYLGVPTDGSAWTDSVVSKCILRGGSWSYDSEGCRVALRSGSDPISGGSNCGFRLLLVQ